MSTDSKEAPNKQAIDAAQRALGFITFDDFLKVDIRAGRITSAERVPKSEKLLKFTVNFGELGTRQILAGVGKSYEPETLVDKTAMFVVNLAPRKMMGLESHGMILAAETPPIPPFDNTVKVAFMSDLIPPGSRLG